MRILAKYVFDGSHIRADLSVKVSDTVTSFLPRFGLRFSLPEQFEDYTYFGYGPYESYEDKRLASHLSVFRDNATDSFEHYVRPQENGSHYGCRWAVAHSPSGCSLMLGAQSFSLSVSHFEPHYLTGFAHDFELVPERHTTLIADYRNSGIGSGSCGPQLLEKYQLKEKEFNFSLAIKPTRISDEFAFAQYKELI